jgi:dipeptidyl aminopeptidase/acylaminoacyl peptidase
MKRATWLVAGLLLAAGGLGLARESGRFGVEDIKGLVAGVRIIEPEQLSPAPIGLGGQVTGFAFAPARPELAYCAIEETQGQKVAVLRIVRVTQLWPQTRLESETWRDPRTGQTRTRGKVVLATPPFGERERELARVPAEGAARSEKDPFLEGPICWSPDMTWLAVYAVGGEPGRSRETRDLWLVDYGKGKKRIVTEKAVVGWVGWSPDSNWLAYLVVSAGGSSKPSRPGLWVTEIGTGKSRRIAEDGLDFRWLADGQRLVFRRGKASTEGQEYNLATGELRPAATWPADSVAVAPWEISPDGTYVATSVKGEGGPGLEVRERVTGGLRLALPRAKGFACWSRSGDLLAYFAEPGKLEMTAVSGPHRGCAVKLTDGVEGYGGAEQPAASWSNPLEDPEDKGVVSWVAFISGGELKALRLKHREPNGHESAALGLLTPEREREIVESNIKQVALALLIYAGDHDDITPAGYAPVFGLVKPYVKDMGMFDRPGYPDEPVFRYLLPGVRLRDVREPAEMPLGVIDYWEEGGYVAFLDGHVRWYPRQKLEQMVPPAEE